MTHDSALGFFGKMIRPFAHLIFIQICIIGIWSFDISFRPYLVKLMLDAVSNIHTDLDAGSKLTFFMILYVGMSGVLTLIFRLHNYISLIVKPGLKQNVGQYVVHHYLNHSQQFYNDNLPGTLVNKIKDLTTGIPELLALLIDQLLPTVLTVFVALGFLSLVHIKFALGLLNWIVLYISGSLYFARRSQSLSRQSAEARSQLTGYYVDLFTNILTVRLFSANKKEEELTAENLNYSVQAERSKDIFFMKLFFFQSITFIIYQMASLFLLREGLMNQTFSPGDFTLILSINIEVIQMLWTVSRDLGEFAITIGTIQQALESVHEEETVQDCSEAKPLKVLSGSVEYKNVLFQHLKDQDLFNQLSLVVPAYQKVGLVGFSGSGKTSFVQLLLRLYDVQSGDILIDQQSIHAVTQESLRKTISFIPQEPGLFHRSIFDNIVYGRVNSTMEEVIEVAKKARAHEFIQNLPLGYDTILGKGVRLSGGQKQRIAIARAMLKNAPILVLDEATSQLDSITEKDIQDAIDDLMQEKTTFVIAHRLSTLQKMNRILVFDQGKIVQDGTHEELISKPGLYSELWQIQMDSSVV
jgi:ATP-binding cassette subfamily B protein